MLSLWLRLKVELLSCELSFSFVCLFVLFCCDWRMVTYSYIWWNHIRTVKRISTFCVETFVNLFFFILFLFSHFLSLWPWRRLFQSSITLPTWVPHNLSARMCTSCKEWQFNWPFFKLFFKTPAIEGKKRKRIKWNETALFNCFEQIDLFKRVLIHPSPYQTNLKFPLLLYELYKE